MRPPAPLLLLAAALAAGVAPEPRPPRIAFEEVTLDNGLRLLLVERPSSPTVAAGWMVRTGSADEQPGQTGVAHLIEHLLFQGTRTVGTRDAERELPLLDEQDALVAELAALAGKRPSRRRGARQGEIERRLDELRGELDRLAFQGELSLLYSEAGGTGLNANTLRDLSVFYVTLPAERLETWFRLESDRLRQPVFRRFDRERRIVHEERRLRYDATPTGRLEAELKERFWGEDPYAWPPMGRAADLDGLDRPATVDFFRRHYRPDRITAALVGGFDPRQARRWAETWLAPLSVEGPAPPRPAAPPPPRPGAYEATCDCPPQVRLLYRTVPFGHPDAAALEMVAGVLGGASGRLRRALVEPGLAVSATAGSHPLRRAGYFEVTAESRPGVEPQAIVAAWRSELRQLSDEPPPDAELRKARNRLGAALYRRLKEPRELLLQLLIYDGLGNARHLDGWPAALFAVTADEVSSAARRYLGDAAPTVGVFRRQGAETAP